MKNYNSIRRSLIHELVKTLTKSEKSYFIKKMGKKDSSYSRLFNLISSQNEYDEQKIISEFAGSYIGNNFSFAKNYLYHSILKSLISYGANKKDAYYYFASVKLLYQKGLYEHCAKLLKQIVKRANEVNDYLSILRVIQYTKLLMHSNLHSDNILLELVTIEGQIIEKQQIVSTYQSLLAEVKSIRIKKGGLKDGDSVERMIKLKNHEYLSDGKKLIDKYCEEMFHETNFLIGFFLQDSEHIKNHIEPLQLMMEQPSYSKIINGYRKIDILQQLIRYNLLNRNYDSAESNMIFLINLLDASPDINESEKIAAYSYLYTFRTDLLLNQGYLDLAEGLFEEISLFLEKNKERISKEFIIVVTGNMLVLRFMMQDYKQVLKLSNNLLVLNRRGIRKDIVISTMLAEIAAFYELNKMDLVESRLNAFDRYLAINNINEITWKLFSELFRNLISGMSFLEVSVKTIFELDKLKSNRIAHDLKFLIDWAKLKSGEEQYYLKS